jgi:putative transposase
MLIEKDNSDISVRTQCNLLGINRSNLYYVNKERPLDREHQLRAIIDMQFMKDPCGVAKMVEYLKRYGYPVGDKLVRRLMRSMDLVAIYPKKSISKKHPEHKIYPYLLRGLDIIRPDQVWAADITYVQLAKGYCYLVAIMDWYSRYVLSWRLSNTLDAAFCVEALKEALMSSKPEIFNTDQGSQFTSLAFTGTLLENDIAISMDGRGRVFDNIFIERLWRTVKYQNIYIQGYETIIEARQGLRKYFKLYNMERLHQGLRYKTPAEVYTGIEFKPELLHLKIA